MYIYIYIRRPLSPSAVLDPSFHSFLPFILQSNSIPDKSSSIPKGRGLPLPFSPGNPVELDIASWWHPKIDEKLDPQFRSPKNLPKSPQSGYSEIYCSQNDLQK